MTTTQDYQDLYNRIAALRQTLVDQLDTELIANPNLAEALGQEVDELLVAVEAQQQAEPVPPDHGLAELVGIGEEAADSLDVTRIPPPLPAYDEPVTSERLLAVADLYYLYQHEMIGCFSALLKLQKLFRAGTVRLSTGDGAFGLYQFDRRQVLRHTLKERMQASVEQTGRELFEGALIRAVLGRHDFDVPESVVDMYVEGRLEDFKKQAGDELPEDFDEAAFMEAGRPDAEKQARWMFIRDRVVKDQDMEISDEDRVTYFEETASGDGLDPEFMMKYYRSMPRMMQQLDDMLLTRKVMDYFADQATVVGKDREAMREEARKERGE